MAKQKKEQKIISTTVRLPEKLHKEITERARNSYRSTGQYIEMILQSHVDHDTDNYCPECGNDWGDGCQPERGMNCYMCEQYQKDQKTEREIQETIEGR